MRIWQQRIFLVNKNQVQLSEPFLFAILAYSNFFQERRRGHELSNALSDIKIGCSIFGIRHFLKKAKTRIVFLICIIGFYWR